MKICFVSLHAYPVVDPAAPGTFGGTETRAVTLARGLAREGTHQISFLARNPHLTEPTTIDGIEWLPWRDFWTETRAHVADHLGVRSGFPYFQLKKWSWSLLWKLPAVLLSPVFGVSRNAFRKQSKFDQLPADLFFTFGVQSVSAGVIANAHRLKKKCVLLTGSDLDVSEQYQSRSRQRNSYGDVFSVCYEILKQADTIVVQNEYQKQQLSTFFERDSFLVRNPVDLSAWQKMCSQKSDKLPIASSDYVLWIGRAETYHKRVDIALQVAQRLPEIPFVFVMNPKDQQTEQWVRENRPENLQILDQVAYEEMPGLFTGAKIFMNTSSAEGFPNVFLQAAASGVPIVSLNIGDDFLSRSQAGFCASGDLEKFITIVRELHANNWQQPDQVKQYLAEHYALEAQVKILLQIIGQQTAST